MKYSVIIPVYNLESYIEDTLESLKDIAADNEIIIVDDGSVDKSAKIIDSFISRNSLANYKVIHQDNAGVSSARNAGIDVAQGEYIIFADGDDILDTKILSLEISSESRVVVWRFQTGANGDFKKSQDEFSKEEYSTYEFLEALFSGRFRIRIGSFAVKRELLFETGIRFTEGCAVCEDVEFIFKILLSAQRIEAKNDILYSYVKREGSAINTFDMRRFEAPVAINRVYEYAASINNPEYDEYIMDNLKYGLFITHCMYSFDSCCRYIKEKQVQQAFWEQYKNDCKDIEDKIKEAKLMMRYEPQIFSWKRRKLFLLSRKLYVKHMCNLGD